MKIQWFTDSCDICFISKSRTQEISKRVHHNIQYSAIFGLSYGLRMTNLYFFSGSLCLHFVICIESLEVGRKFRISGRKIKFFRRLDSRNPQFSRSVDFVWLIYNLGDTGFCGNIYYSPMVFSMQSFLESILSMRGSASLWALCTGGAIAGYTLVDKIGVTIVYPPAYI